MTTSQAVEPTIPAHLNPNVRNLRPSATLAMNEKSRELARQGRKIYKLGFGQSPFPVPPSVVAALQANAARKDYLAVKGLPELREAVADFHRRRHGVAATGEDILIGPGSKELMFHLQLCFQAELLVPSPSWVSYEPQAALLGLPRRWLHTRKEHGWKVMPDELDRFCREGSGQARLLVLNYPNNPTGVTFTDDELVALAQVARRHKLLVLSDEIYGELNHTGNHVSLAKHYPEGTIISSGLSKWCGAGGWRLGTFCMPRELRCQLPWLLDAMACTAGETFSAVSAPVQYAAVAAFQGGNEMERYLFQGRRILRSLSQNVGDRLNKAGIETVASEGGFYHFPDFSRYAESLGARGIKTSSEFCERLLSETGVALLPGTAFGRLAEELTCRLAYVDFDGEQALAAAETVADDQEVGEEFLYEYCGEVIAAIELIRGWLGRREAF